MISIILPTFNRSHILTSTISNVMEQTFVEYELIIINDASSDNTEKIIHTFQAQDKRIKYIKNELIPKYKAINPSAQPLNKYLPIIKRTMDKKIKYLAPFKKT